MAFNIPLPDPNIDRIGQGAITLQNILDSISKNRIAQQTAPSDIAYKQAMSQHAMNLDEQSQIMAPLLQAYKQAQLGQLQQQAPLNLQLLQAKIAAQQGLANNRQNGMNGNGGNMSVGQKEIAGLKRQLSEEHPEWDSQKVDSAASAYLSGMDNLNGEKLPIPSGIAQSLIAQIGKRNSTASIQNQAANYDVLAKQLEEIDITPITKFQGIQGRVRYANEVSRMARGQPVSDDFREYQAFKDVVSLFSMDALRKGFGTSVVPEYVTTTLGKASDPSSVWWNDPQQVRKDWEKTTNWIQKENKHYATKARSGATAPLDNAPQTQKELTYNVDTGEFE